MDRMRCLFDKDLLTMAAAGTDGGRGGGTLHDLSGSRQLLLSKKTESKVNGTDDGCMTREQSGAIVRCL